MQFLVDEDLPRSLVFQLRAAGITADDVRDRGLRGRPDSEVFDEATASGATLITADMGFSNLVHYPVGSHAGIVIVRLPDELPTPVLNTAIISALRQLSDEEIRGNFVVIEPGRVRLRRQPPGKP